MSKNNKFNKTVSNTNVENKESTNTNSTNKGTRNRGSRGSSNSKKYPQDNSHFDASKGINDPAWYASNKELLASAASFSYNAALGSPLRLDRLVGSGKGSTKIDPTTSTVPGFAAIHVHLTPGLAVDHQSPINIAAQNAYTFVRYKNSGHSNYDPADLMLYYLAMDSVYSFFNWMKRLYGMFKSYSQYNRYTPADLISAQYVDYNDLVDKLANFRTYINQYGARATSFCVPATMPLFIRHSWMFSNMYLDANTPKSQTYMFVPAGFYQYDETSSPHGGILKEVPIPRSKAMTLEDIKNYGDAMLNALQYSEDIGIMSGDIMKAYEQSGLVTLSAVTEDYTIEAVFNEEVLTQIHNLTIVNSDSKTDTKIVQDPNTGDIHYNPSFPTASNVHHDGIQVNLPYAKIEPAHTMVATRLTSALKTSDKDRSVFQVCGSEFVSAFVLYNKRGTDSTTNEAAYSNMTLTGQTFTGYILIDTTKTLAEVRSALATITEWSVLDWAPMCAVEVTNGTETWFMGYAGDYNMYTFIDLPAATDMNLTAVMSLLDIPAGNVKF